MKKSLFFVCAMLLFLGVRAQYNSARNQVWYFGDSAAVSFSSGSPATSTSGITAAEGCASVCDATGNLIFYTEGTNIINAAHTHMPNGTNVCAPYTTLSTTQGVAVVPMPDEVNKYYVFSLGATSGGSDGNCKLVYSVVDMTLDGGLGDVSTVGTPLNVGDSLSEKMVTVQGNNCNVWLIVHRRSTPQMLVYEITAAGISAPATYNFGGYRGQLAFYLGAMKVSPDGRKLVSQSQRMVTPGRTELYDFDPGTGVVSNRQIVDTGDMYDPYSAEFSEDNSRLYSFLTMYISSTIFSRIWQYDLTMPTLAAISASRTTAATYTGFDRRDLRLAPDGKIYVGRPQEQFLDCIPFPNAVGTACGYLPNAVNLAPTGMCYSGLPTTIQAPRPDYDTTTQDIHQCRPAAGHITLTPPSTGLSYIWYDGSSATTHNVTVSGNYWVHILNGCDVLIDTFRVQLDTAVNVFVGNDTTINDGDVIALRALPTGPAYVWSNGHTGDTIHVSAAGTYWARTTGELCMARDTVVVTVTAGVADIRRGVTMGVYPNPATNMVTVSGDGLYGSRVTVSVMDIRGAVVTTGDEMVRNGGFRMQMDTAHLPAGVYMMRVEDDAGYSVVKKIVVQK